jgi:hypothetical protein
MTGRDRYLVGYAGRTGGDRERQRVAVEPPAIFRNP